jgi:HD-GYP domain-containing protein (c-di-GMP phosphodiesterase class II)
MLKLPPELFLNAGPLQPQARKTIMAHTLLGYRIMKSVSANENIALGVSEHQERVDGSGYPKRLKGDAISQYARIIAVACSYDAIVSPRPHKKNRSGQAAMLDLLKANRKAYDEQVLKAFVYCLALYPLGTHVLLSNGTRGQVVKANPENPRCPVVRILQDQDGINLEEKMMVKISPDENGLTITRTLKADEIKNL